MDMDGMKKLLEKLAEGITEVKASQAEMKASQAEIKTSQDEMKTGLSNEIKSIQDQLTREMKEELQGLSAAQDVMKEVMQKGFLL